MPEFDPTDYSVHGLLRCYGEILEELRNRNVIRTYNSPIGDYVEWIVADKLGLDLSVSSRTGCDAVASDGTRYQIKGRWRPTPGSSRQLSTIRGLGDKHFDFLIAVLLGKGFEIAEIYRIPHAVIGQYARSSAHVNGHNLHLQGELLSVDGVEDITHLFVSGASVPQVPRNAVSPHPKKVAVHPSKVNSSGDEIPGLPKAEAVARLNSKLGRPKITSGDCHFANRFSSREFWWLEVPLRKFGKGVEKAIHVLLYDGLGNDLYHLEIPAAYFRDNLSSFNIREDVNKVSLKLSVDVVTRFQDISSGGGGMPFTQFLQV